MEKLPVLLFIFLFPITYLLSPAPPPPPLFPPFLPRIFFPLPTLFPLRFPSISLPISSKGLGINLSLVTSSETGNQLHPRASTQEGYGPR